MSPQYNLKRPYESLYNSLVRNCNWNGKRRVNIGCVLTFEEFLEFVVEGQCHYCHTAVTWTKHNIHDRGASYNLDRKQNTLGYSKDNCVVCCFRCNRAKSSHFTYEEWWAMTTIYRRTEQLSNFNVGDVVVHKTAGNLAMVVIPNNPTMGKPDDGQITTRRFTADGFTTEVLWESELETQLESIDREAEIFKVVNGKQREINGDGSLRPIPINHLN